MIRDEETKKRSEAEQIAGTISEIRLLAIEVAAGRARRDAPRLAELCTRHGPEAVQTLEAFFKAAVRHFARPETKKRS